MAVLNTQQLIAQAQANQPNNSEGLIDPIDTRQQDINTAESSVNKITDAPLLGVKDYDLTRQYVQGEGCFFNGELYRSNKPTGGVFVPADWDKVGSEATGLVLGALINGLILTGTGVQVLELQAATASVPGALLPADFQRFDAKQDALTFTPEDAAKKGAADGYAPLNSSQKIEAQYLPDSVTGALVYQGVWDASSNTPTLADGTGTKGHYYIVNVAGQQNLGSGTLDFAVGDWVVHNGSTYDKLDNTHNGIQSVQGITNPNVDLGSGVAGAVTFWNTDGKTFNSGAVFIENNRLAIGSQAKGSTLPLAISQISTGFSYAVNTTLGYKAFRVQNNGTVFVEYFLYDAGKRLTDIGGGLDVGRFNNYDQHLRIRESKAGVAQLLLDPTGDAVTNPINGQVWSTAAGLFYRFNGTTINLVTGSGGGEANTGENVGGGLGLYKDKNGLVLRFKTLVAGANMTITPDGDTLVFAASGAGSDSEPYEFTGFGLPAQINGYNARYNLELFSDTSKPYFNFYSKESSYKIVKAQVYYPQKSYTGEDEKIRIYGYPIPASGQLLKTSTTPANTPSQLSGTTLLGTITIPGVINFGYYIAKEILLDIDVPANTGILLELQNKSASTEGAFCSIQYRNNGNG